MFEFKKMRSVGDFEEHNTLANKDPKLGPKPLDAEILAVENILAGHFGIFMTRHLFSEVQLFLKMPEILPIAILLQLINLSMLHQKRPSAAAA